MQSALITSKCGQHDFTFFKSFFSFLSDKPALTKAENFRGMKDSSSKEKSSRLTHDVLPSKDPVTPRTKTVSLDPTIPKQDLTSSETHEWVLPVSERANVLVFEEPFFNPISLICKAPLQARDTVQDVSPFSFWEPWTTDVEVSLCNKLLCDFPQPLFRHFNLDEHS